MNFLSRFLNRHFYVETKDYMPVVTYWCPECNGDWYVSYRAPDLEAQKLITEHSKKHTLEVAESVNEPQVREEPEPRS